MLTFLYNIDEPECNIEIYKCVVEDSSCSINITFSRFNNQPHIICGVIDADFMVINCTEDDFKIYANTIITELERIGYIIPDNQDDA